MFQLAGQAQHEKYDAKENTIVYILQQVREYSCDLALTLDPHFITQRGPKHHDRRHCRT